MKVRLPFSQRFAAPLALAIILFAHGLWVISDARFLDGTYFEYFLEQGRWDVVTWNMYGVLMHPWAWLMWPLLGTEHPGWVFRFVEWISIAVIGLCVLRVSSRHARLDNGEALFLALAVALFPSYSAAMMSSAVIYLFPTALFYLGWTFYFDAMLSRPVRPWRQALIAPMWILAFFHNSLLAFHYGFAALLLALSLMSCSLPLDTIAARLRFIAAFVRQHVMALALPLLFFVLRKATYPADSPFGSHNNLIFDPARNFRAFLGGFHHHVSMNLSAAFLDQEWLLGLVLAALGVWLALSWRRGKPVRKTMWIVGFAAMFAVLAIFPYAAVGKAAPLQSFGARYGLLSGLGGGLMLLAIWRSLPRSRLLAMTVAILFLAGLAGRGISDDLMWLGRWAKDRAVLRTLQTYPPPEPGTILLWNDDFRIGNETYRPFELSWFFRQSWGRESWLGIDLLERDLATYLQQGGISRNKDTNIISEFEANGCTRVVTVRAREPGQNPVLLGTRYLAFRLFSTQALDAVLDDLVVMNMAPAHCAPVSSLFEHNNGPSL